MLPKNLPILLLSIAGLGQAAAKDVEVLHFDGLNGLVVESPNSTGDANGRGALALRFDSLGQRFALELEPNAPINDIARRVSREASTTAYKGVVSGLPSSWVRITYSPNGPSGLIWDGAHLFGIEPPSDTDTGSQDPAIFRVEDLVVEAGSAVCGMEPLPATGAATLEQIVTESQAVAELTATLNLELGIIADVEFSSANEPDPSAALVARINNVDGIFSEQLGVKLTIADVTVFDAEPDPFSQSDAPGLLDELRAFRSASSTQGATGLTHLFTGRNLDGSTVGIAYFGALCSRDFGAGLSEGLRGPVFDSLIAAHEIGHNFGAPHDGDPDQACATTPETFLMAPSITGSDQFSQCSIEQMQIEIASASCLTDINYPDLALMPLEEAPSALANVEFDYIVVASNQGAQAATGASLEMTFDPGLQVLAATPSAGSCDAPQSTMTCTLGEIPSGSSRDIVFRLVSQSVDGFAVTGAVSVADDVNLGNNFMTDSITIDPAVDLSVTSAPIRLVRAEPGNMSVSIDNRSALEATGVHVVGSLSTGLRPDAASIAGVPCAISDQTVDCFAASIQAYSGAALELALTPLAAGAQSLTIDATASQTEIDPADNELLVSIDVFDRAGTQQSSSGGGAAGRLCLLALATLLLVRRLPGYAARARSSDTRRA
jgi:hypothetical protein